MPSPRRLTCSVQTSRLMLSLLASTRQTATPKPSTPSVQTPPQQAPLTPKALPADHPSHLRSAMSVLMTFCMSSSESFTRVTPVELMVLVTSFRVGFCTSSPVGTKAHTDTDTDTHS